jgi:hypothetical protein
MNDTIDPGIHLNLGITIFLILLGLALIGGFVGLGIAYGRSARALREALSLDESSSDP